MPVFELKGTAAYEWMKEKEKKKEKNTLRVIPHYEHTTRDGAFAVAVEKGAPSNAIVAEISIVQVGARERRKRQRQSQIPRWFPVPRAVRAGLWI